MQGNMLNVERIGGYNEAARHFEETKKPRTVRWGEDERPLYNTRSHHYRLVKGSDFYDLVLYSTPMIRYYKPEANGDSRVLVRGHYSTTSNAFLWHHGFQRGKPLNCVDAHGNARMGKLLLNHHVSTQSARDYGVPDHFSADLMFIGSQGNDYYNQLDLTRSKHIPGYKAASSEEDKAKRKQLKGLVDHWIELLGYRLDEYLTTSIEGLNKWVANSAGDSFTSALELVPYDLLDGIREAIKHALESGETKYMEEAEFTEAMTTLGHAVATHLQGVRENQAAPKWDYKLRQRVPTQEVQPVTRADFRKSMESHLISLMNLRTGSARVDIGQFPESIPSKWWC